MLYENPEAEVKFLSSYDPLAQISKDDAKNEVLALLCIISGEYNEDIIEEFIGTDVFSSLEEKWCTKTDAYKPVFKETKHEYILIILDIE